MKPRMEKEPRMEKKQKTENKCRKRGNEGQAEAAKKRRGFGVWCLLSLAMAMGACSSKEEKVPPPEESLAVEIVHSTATLTPMETGTYSERSTTFMLWVSGPKADDSVQLKIAPVEGLTFKVESRFEDGLKTFEVSVHYNGKSVFPEGVATLQLGLNVPGGQPTTQTLRIAVADGQERERPILLNQANMEHFNHWANTADGRWMHYRLTEDIVLEPPAPRKSNWRPIGSSASFAGSLDGGGHNIVGLTMTGTTESSLGLFAHTHREAVIENLGLTEVEIENTSAASVGSLVGVNAGTVQNCHATGNVSSTDAGTGTVVGGLIGDNGGPVKNCHATVNVRRTGSGNFGKPSHVGGLIGNSSGPVENCHAEGNVSTFIDKEIVHIGGLIGNSTGSVQDCYATGDVSNTGTGSGTRRIGGLLGLNSSGPVQNSYATGSVTNTGPGSSIYVGGVVGHSFGTVQNCYATGSVTNTNTGPDNSICIGGLIGTGEGVTQNSYATGSITNTGPGYIIALGGLIGDGAFIGRGVTQNSYATGNVTNTGVGSERIFVGGLMGIGKAQDCYATGNVSNSGTGTAVFVGGLLGETALGETMN